MRGTERAPSGSLEKETDRGSVAPVAVAGFFATIEILAPFIYNEKVGKFKEDLSLRCRDEMGCREINRLRIL